MIETKSYEVLFTNGRIWSFKLEKRGRFVYATKKNSYRLDPFDEKLDGPVIYRLNAGKWDRDDRRSGEVQNIVAVSNDGNVTWSIESLS